MASRTFNTAAPRPAFPHAQPPQPPRPTARKPARRSKAKGRGKAMLAIPKNADILARLFTTTTADIAQNERLWFCDECEVVFELSSGQHSQCATRPVPAPKPALRSVAAATYRGRDLRKFSTGFPTLDRVFGVREGVGTEFCGVQSGQVIIVGGPKGHGKSTLLGMVLRNLARLHGMRVLYNSGEEGPDQVTDRLRRTGLNVDDRLMRVLGAHSLVELADEIIAFRPHVVVQDSLQTLLVDQGRNAGQASQVTKATEALTAFAKGTGAVVILVNQLNSDGSLAGSERSLHNVDTIIRAERDMQGWLHVHSREKNRMGPPGELATFEMTSKGLVEVVDPGAALTNALLGEPGIVAFPCAANSRPTMLPIEAVVGDPREDGGSDRQVYGISAKRFKHILTMLREYSGIELAGRDIRVKVPQFAGLNMADEEVCDSSIDLAVYVALVSSASRIIPPRWGFFGELTLTGKVMPAMRADARLDACRRANLPTIACSSMCTVSHADPPSQNAATDLHRDDVSERQSCDSAHSNQSVIPRINHAKDVPMVLLVHGQRTLDVLEPKTVK